MGWPMATQADKPASDAVAERVEILGSLFVGNRPGRRPPPPPANVRRPLLGDDARRDHCRVLRVLMELGELGVKTRQSF